MKQLFVTIPENSKYIRTTCLLIANSTLEFFDSSKVRFISESEANTFVDSILKKNVFARHSWEKNFYIQRASDLANRTVIEVIRPGNPMDISDVAENITNIIEKIVLLSFTIVSEQDQIQKLLGITPYISPEIDYVIGPAFYYLKSRIRKTANVKGIVVDDQFCRRFNRLGFHDLYKVCVERDGIASRIKLTLDWLYESRIDPNPYASVVKTAIALESLLIFNASESLSRSLAERIAFILSSDSERRKQISKIVKIFYEVRSGIVHGGKIKLKKYTPSLIEAIKRIAIFTCLTISANQSLWSSAESLGEWCENQRWGTSSTDRVIPFPDIYLRNAIAKVKNIDM